MSASRTNLWLFHLVFAHKQKVFFSGLICAVIGLTVSLLIPKKYEASGLVYANHSNNIKEVALHPSFGAEYQADKLVQLFESQPMEQMLIHDFNLLRYYNIDTLETTWRYQLQQQMAKDIAVERNAFLTVELYARTKDAEMSAAMVNRMISYVDTVRKEVFHANLALYVTDLKMRVQLKEQLVQQHLNAIFEYSHPQATKNMLSEHTIQVIETREENADFVHGDAIVKEAVANNYSMALEKMVDAYYLELGRYNTLKHDLENAQQTLDMPFPGVYKIRGAEPNYQPVSPKIGVNTFLSFLIGSLLSVLILVYANNVKAWKANPQ